jgi:hypothetical protein
MCVRIYVCFCVCVYACVWGGVWGGVGGGNIRKRGQGVHMGDARLPRGQLALGACSGPSISTPQAIALLDWRMRGRGGGMRTVREGKQTLHGRLHGLGVAAVTRKGLPALDRHRTRPIAAAAQGSCRPSQEHTWPPQKMTE